MSKKESVWTAAYDASKDSTVFQTSEVLPGVFVVKMNSPETHNMLTPLSMGALAREIDRLSAIEDEKVCIDVRLSGFSD
jgi:enoyl-CoA hydratase/carnithine racemase